jgi:hypothetical protein
MEFCCTGSSSVLWRTRRAPSGGQLLAPISGNCRCCIHSADNAHWYAGNKQIHGDFGVHLLTDYIVSLGISTKSYLRVEPLTYTTRQISTLIERLASSPKTGRSGSRTCSGYLYKTAMLHIESCPRGTFRLHLMDIFPVLCSSVAWDMTGYNTHRRGTLHTCPT